MEPVGVCQGCSLVFVELQRLANPLQTLPCAHCLAEVDKVVNIQTLPVSNKPWKGSAEGTGELRSGSLGEKGLGVGQADLSTSGVCK